MARALSNPLTVGAAEGRWAGEGGRWAAGRWDVAGAAVGAAAARPLAVGGGGSGAGGATDGPPGGNVGSLIVGAAEGLGGRLMRTVSFFG